MVHSNKATSVYRTNQCSSRNGERPNKIIWHHWAGGGTVAATAGMMVSGAREVSSHYVVKDREAASVVDELDSSWSLGNQTYERSCVTFEIGNSATGDASGWPISDESAETVCQITADIATRYNIPVSRATIKGHQEVAALGYSYPTACPGGIMERIDAMIRRVQEIQIGHVVEELINGGNETMIPIRNVNDGSIHVNTAYTHYHEGSPDRAHISLALADLSGANLPKDAKGNKTFPGWNWLQIAWLHQVIDRNAAELKKVVSGTASAPKLTARGFASVEDAEQPAELDRTQQIPGVESVAEIANFSYQDPNANAVPVEEIDESDRKGEDL